MHPSNSYYAGNNIDVNLFSPSKSSIYEISPTSEQVDSHPHPLYFNIPSPFSHYENDDVLIQHMCDLYYQGQSHVDAPDLITTEMHEHCDNVNKVLEECSIKQNEDVVIKENPKKKTSKKDRHSKIETAQGPRDRRMRLSLQVARDFFDLQDTLGYNKASKTVEWLLTKSKLAIKDLGSSSSNSPSSTSECEVLSKEKGKHLVSPSKEAKGTRGTTRKSAFNPLAKESREKARERARERTKEKRKGHGSISSIEATKSHQMNPLESWSQDDSNGFQPEMLEGFGELSSSMIFNYDMCNHGVPQEQQFPDFNLYGKPWDVYSNINLC